MEGKDFHLTREVKYMQRRAAEHDGRFVTIGPLVSFSTQTADAWMLEPSDELPARLARGRDPEPIELRGNRQQLRHRLERSLRIEGRAFVYTDRESGRVTMILGYPAAKIAQLG